MANGNLLAAEERACVALGHDRAAVARLVLADHHLTQLMLRALARPEGFERTPPTIVIRGVEELVEALLAA